MADAYIPIPDSPASTLESPLSQTLCLGQRSSKPRHWNLTDVIIDLGVEAMKLLLDLRRRGYDEETIDDHFKWQKDQCMEPSTEQQVCWFKAMRSVMREIDGHAFCIPAMGDFRFLDLGCNPGGFSSYILLKNPVARGVGVSLSTEKGGHKILLEWRLRPRFKLHEADMLRLDLASPNIQPTPGFDPVSAIVHPGGFDLVILDGHFLWTYAPDGPASAGTAPQWEAQRLLIAQLILAFRALKPGGTLIMKLTQPERTVTAKLLCMLDMLSSKLVTFKPTRQHTSRSSFYAIASGVGYGSKGNDLGNMEASLRDLWLDISVGGEEGKGRWLEQPDLDWIIPDEELKTQYIDRLIELGMPVWLGQLAGLRRLFERKGISVDA